MPVPMKKCANPECDHEFPDHYLCNLCGDCARKFAEAEEDERLTLSNAEAPELAVEHTRLTRSGDSKYRSECPACKKGTLLVGRGAGTGRLMAHDRCILCGQRVRYTDIAGMRQRLDGEPSPEPKNPSLSLSHIMQELNAHVAELRRTGVKRRLIGQITILRGAAILVASANDGMGNKERVEKVEEALSTLKGEGGHE